MSNDILIHDIPYLTNPTTFINTDYFCEEAKRFVKYNTYCDAPEGTYEYQEYWDEQDRRCREGYTVGGIRITGEHYAYLNFGRIKITEGEGKKARKYEGFPRFLDMDYYYYHELEKAKLNKEGIIVAKSRRKGFEQPNSELVLTPFGFKPMGTLKPNDLVMNPDGYPTRILEVYPQGKKDVYELELRDGRKVKCGLEHLWEIIDQRGKKRIVNTKFFLDKKLKRNKGNKCYYAYFIENCKPLNFYDLPLPIDPYLLGVLIGDGSLTKSSLEFSSNDEQLVNIVKDILKSRYNVNKTTTPFKYSITVKDGGPGTPNNLLRFIQNLKLNVKSYDKFIPEIYKKGSYDTRLELLKGLMDTDGTSSPNGTCRFTSSSETLANDVVDICRSLGLRATKSKSSNGRKLMNFPNNKQSIVRDSWVVNIITDYEIFKLDRKNKNIKKRKYNHNKVAITSVKKLDYQEESSCILVENPNHLYITRDYIVTHNSYKGAFNTVYEYNWYRNSFSIIAAFLAEYSQTTMNMALDMINFINTNTDWAKRKLIDTRQYIKSGFKEKINGIEVESGFKSEIMTMSFKDNPFKSIGKSASVMLFEEAGKWTGLIESYMLSKPLFSDGEIMIGIPIIYGTGGDMEGGTQDFADMFYNPSSYGLRAYENIWDENAIGSCGWFVDDSWYKPPYVDKDGNSDRAKAKESLLLKREIVKKSGNKRAYEKEITQQPLSPAEAFLRTSGNRFPLADLQIILSQVEGSERIQNTNYIGDIVFNPNSLKYEWKPNPNLNPLKEFPLTKDQDSEGCVVIYEMPYEDEEGNVPFGRYLAGTDPYDHDQSGTTSLGSTIIIDKITNRIVAEYTARPKTANEYYEILRRLLHFYNARCLYENEKKGLFQYLEGKNETYLLLDQPAYIKDVIQNSKVERGKGMHMNKSLKDHGEDLIIMWLLEDYDSSNGIKNMHKIRCIPLLKELIAYNPEGNFDRVMSLMMCMYHIQEVKKVKIEEANDKNDILNSDFWNRKLFTKRKNKLW